MNTSLRIAAFVLVLAGPSLALAQTNEKTPAPDPVKPELTDAGASLASAMGVGVLSHTGRAELDHMGAYNVYGGSVCMNSLSLTNPATTTKEAEKTTYTKTVDAFVKTASVIEVLDGGDSLDLLDEGEAGENILDRGEAGENVTIVKASVGADTDLGLDKSTPILSLTGAFGAEGCTPVGVLFTAPGERFSMAFVAGGHVVGVAAGTINEIRTNPQGNGNFTMNLIAPVAMDKGIVMGLISDIPEDDFWGDDNGEIP